MVARQRDQDDHITWLLEHEMFEVSFNLNDDNIQHFVYQLFVKQLPYVKWIEDVEYDVWLCDSMKYSILPISTTIPTCAFPNL